ncbi:MAG: FAD-dependent oxidoreductase [Pirellulales bacterium]|nr:FAD-dependent oxidoreductase [Pirellulales bacterium]
MIRVAIDGTWVEVPVGASVLDAARQAGVDVPALCCHPDFPPNASCMCCLVRIDGAATPTPSCATKVRDGMQVESETAEIRALRRTGLELLLGDHAGDCRAPCENTCPARMDVPDMLRHVVDGDYRTALAVVKRDIALPAVLGRVCPEVCESACRRGQHDSPAAICKIKRFVADRDLESLDPYLPEIAPPTGRRIAIVGGGPTGLTAAYHLALRGHACTIFEAQPHLGGRLRSEFTAEELPPSVLAAEIVAVLRAGIATSYSQRIDARLALDALLVEYDAVLLATGRTDRDVLAGFELRHGGNGVQVDPATRLTSCDRVFAAGNVVRPYKLVVQSVAEGKLAAECIDCRLANRPVPDRRKAFESRLQRMTAGELCDYCEGTPTTPRIDARLFNGDVSEDAVRQEAARCLHCDCEALHHCLLHHYAEAYDCDARRFAGPGQHYRGRIEGRGVRLEIGKCIACGICVQIAAATPDAVGLALTGRSTAIRVAPPAGTSLDAALGSAARQCAEACPTGAFVVDAS